MNSEKLLRGMTAIRIAALPSPRLGTTLAPREFSGVGALVLLWVVFACIAPSFTSPVNMANVLSQSADLLVLSLGQMLVIVTRGFDISVGSIAVLASMVGAQAALRFGDTAAIGAALVTGLAFGTINGYLIAYRRIEPIIATLGTALVARGLATAASCGADALLLPSSSGLHALAYRTWLGLPALMVCALPLLFLAWWLAARTPLGRWLYMIGSHADAARLVGVPVRRARLAAYVLCGGCAGVAGVLLLARSGSAVAVDGNGMELQAIAACVIGGISLMGGQARVWQVVAGALFIQALLNGLNLTGASPFMSECVLGLIIVISGSIDFLIRQFQHAFPARKV
ncbi:ABC transporter permease [Pararobbsia silviterrae]|uniref:Autoinducer 2 import system permease protein LsrC n=1 Tax=Pararobbsia silviterrae TaxID=1792498 RepID=A0A494XWB0_9BURK|nr:ABC transporter permease [Pararobbsia silviterrae]RKP53266.1 ABC transporter permease [Pararobbsia silviterrae]